MAFVPFLLSCKSFNKKSGFNSDASLRQLFYYCSDFQNESNGIFVLGMGVFSSNIF